MEQRRTQQQQQQHHQQQLETGKNFKKKKSKYFSFDLFAKSSILHLYASYFLRSAGGTLLMAANPSSASSSTSQGQGHHFLLHSLKVDHNGVHFGNNDDGGGGGTEHSSASALGNACMLFGELRQPKLEQKQAQQAAEPKLEPRQQVGSAKENILSLFGFWLDV